MFSLVCNHLKIRIVVFRYLKMSPLYLQRERVLVHVSTVAQTGSIGCNLQPDH